jgi:hypothetical protein
VSRAVTTVRFDTDGGKAGSKSGSGCCGGG